MFLKYRFYKVGYPAQLLWPDACKSTDFEASFKSEQLQQASIPKIASWVGGLGWGFLEPSHSLKLMTEPYYATSIFSYQNNGCN